MSYDLKYLSNFLSNLFIQFLARKNLTFLKYNLFNKKNQTKVRQFFNSYNFL